MSNQQQPLPWPGVVALGAVILLVVTSSWPAIRFLVDRGWSESLAALVVFGSGGVLIVSAMTITSVVHRRTRVSVELVKGLAFIIVILVLIFIVQGRLAAAFESFGWPREVQYHGAWLAAIAIVGWPAELVRRKLHIDFPMRKAPPNSR